MTKEERTVREAFLRVEALGADVQLTRAGSLLMDAQRLLADWHDDGRPGGNTLDAVEEILADMKKNDPPPDEDQAETVHVFEAYVDRANDTQVAGDHYKSLPLEPWDLTTINGLDAFQHEICAYVIRHPMKHGLQDLEKAQHWLAKYIEVLTLYKQAGGGVEPRKITGAVRDVAIAILRAAIAKLERAA